jgi:putative ABC transport system ATP-binding protein
MDRSEAVTADYIRAHRRFFRYSFAQTLAYFLVYAFAASALLALGAISFWRASCRSASWSPPS